MAVERVQSDQFPFLPVRVTTNAFSLEVVALIDTGFDGDLVMPAAEIPEYESPDDYQIWGLADGSEVATPIYYGTLQVGRFPPLEVNITALGDDPILGRGVTDRYRLILDRGERVIVEP